MRFVVDADVPNSVVAFQQQRGHELHLSRLILMPDSPDPLIAKAASDLHAVVLTWNRKDFLPLIMRKRGPYSGYTYPGMHLITFDNCTHSEGLQRRNDLIDELETASAVRVEQRGRRLVAVIAKRYLKLEDLP